MFMHTSDLQPTRGCPQCCTFAAALVLHMWKHAKAILFSVLMTDLSVCAPRRPRHQGKIYGRSVSYDCKLTRSRWSCGLPYTCAHIAKFQGYATRLCGIRKGTAHTAVDIKAT